MLVATGLKASVKNAVEMSKEETLTAQQVRTNLYEVLGEVNRVFLDIDGKRLSSEMTKAQFDALQAEALAAIERGAGDEPYALATSSKYESRVISFRVVYPKVKTSKKSNKAFAVKMREVLKLPQGVSVDDVPYGENQKIRMVGSSKDGEDRPFVMVHGDPEDMLISYVGDAEEREFDETHGEDRQGRVPMDPQPSSPPADTKELRDILDCVSVASWTDYATCLRLIWAMKQEGADDDLIHSYCMKAGNYGRTWVDNLCRNHKPSPSSPSIAFIRKIARQDNKSRYIALAFPEDKPSVAATAAVEELFQLTTDEDTVIDNGRHVSPMPDAPTSAFKGTMGLGKSVEVRRQIREKLAAGVKSILILSARIALSNETHNMLKSSGFVHYKDWNDENYKRQRAKKEPLPAPPLLIMQVSPSLARIEAAEYEFVIADESEALLSMLSPSKKIYPQRSTYLAVVKTFERVVRSAKWVVAMDAFLTDRTMNVLRALRPQTKPLLVINPTKPHQYTYEEFHKEQFVMKLRSEITAGKRVACVWGTKPMANAFHDWLTERKVKNELYHADTDQKVATLHTADVNSYWAPLQCVGYTSKISVGTNYTADPSFDFVAVHTYQGAAPARDAAQASRRARDNKEGRFMLFMEGRVNSEAAKVGIGLHKQEELWAADTQVKRDFLKSLDEDLGEYTTLPEWLKHLLIWNRNETAVNRVIQAPLMRRYMEEMGARPISAALEAETAEKKKPDSAAPISLDDVMDLDWEQAEWIRRHRHEATIADIYALKKLDLSMFVKELNQPLWEAWLKNESVIRNAYAVVHRTAKSMLPDHKVIDLVPKDIGRLGVVQTLGYDFTKDWAVKVSEVPKLDLNVFALREWTEKDGPEQYARELARALNGWCGTSLAVERKRVRRKEALAYEYTLVHTAKESVITQIRPRETGADVFPPE
jgi:hypothetical protein